MTSLPTTVRPSSHVLFQDLDQEAVLLNMQNERYYSLDDTGTRMWQLLTESDDVGAAVDRLLLEYEVDESTLRRDLADLIERLEAAGLVETER